MRVLFAGTPPFAARALEALARAGHVVPLVLTQPDRAAGRGMKLSRSAVALAAAGLGQEIFQPSTLRDAIVVERLREARADVMVVAAYGLILPREVLGVPRLGCINIHASLLPRWRGAAPIQRAILAGDARTGITIMQMDAGLDTGPVLSMHGHPIGDRDTAGVLTDALAQLGAEAIVATLARIDSLTPKPQDDGSATYAAKVTKAEARIDWSLDAIALERRVRAFNPAPGAETRMPGGTLKIWEARASRGDGRPGELLDVSAGRLIVACGQGALEVLTLQRPGGNRMPAREFLRGAALAAGTVLDSASPTAA